MNLFKKALIAVLGLGLVVAPSTVDRVEATKGKGDETWSLTGSMTGWNVGSKTYTFTYDANDSAGARYELEIALNANDEFKIIYNYNSWDIGYGGNTGAGISTYLSNSGGNFKVKKTGNYLLWVKDDNVHGYGDKSYGFGIEEIVATYHTITYYAQDGSVLDSEEVIENSTFNSKFEHVEGYRLEGWYSDSSLTTKFEKGTKVTTDLNLYPNYVACEDYNVYFKDNGTLGSTVYAYMYRDTLDGDYAVGWPGTALTKDANGYWQAEIDASQSYSKIIFNGGEGKSQTANLELTNEDTLYTIGAKDSEGKYTATATSLAAGKAANLSVRYQENGTSLRLISTLGAAGDESFSLDSYTNVGFKFSNGTKEKEVVAGYVYTSVVANGEPISAAAYDAQYFFVTTFNNVPEGTSLTVTPYATLANGFVYYGTPVTVTVSY